MSAVPATGAASFKVGDKVRVIIEGAVDEDGDLSTGPSSYMSWSDVEDLVAEKGARVRVERADDAAPVTPSYEPGRIYYSPRTNANYLLQPLTASPARWIQLGSGTGLLLQDHQIPNDLVPCDPVPRREA